MKIKKINLPGAKEPNFIGSWDIDHSICNNLIDYFNSNHLSHHEGQTADGINKNEKDSIDLTILSDHGARIKKTKDSRLPSIFAFRNDKTIYKENKGKKILQGLFTEHLK